METHARSASAEDQTHRHQCVSVFPYPRDNLLVHTAGFTANRELQRPDSSIHALVWTVSRLGHVRAVTQEHQFLSRSGRDFQRRANSNLEISQIRATQLRAAPVQ